MYDLFDSIVNWFNSLGTQIEYLITNLQTLTEIAQVYFIASGIGILLIIILQFAVINMIHDTRKEVIKLREEIHAQRDEGAAQQEGENNG